MYLFNLKIYDFFISFTSFHIIYRKLLILYLLISIVISFYIKQFCLILFFVLFIFFEIFERFDINWKLDYLKRFFFLFIFVIIYILYIYFSSIIYCYYLTFLKFNLTLMKLYVIKANINIFDIY